MRSKSPTTPLPSTPGNNFPPPLGGVPLHLKVFRTDPNAALPRKFHLSDVGYDICACLVSESNRPITKPLHKGVTAVPTGLIVRPPPGHFVAVCSRSGLAAHGLFVANSPGIIDPSYSGELIILIFNGSHETKYVKHGDRIAQLVLLPAIYAEVSELKDRPKPLERGVAGFGSTGE